MAAGCAGAGKNSIPRSRYPRRLWNAVPPIETAKRGLVTAVPMRNDSAAVKLTEPGAYKFIAVTHDDKIFDRFDRMFMLRDGRLDRQVNSRGAPAEVVTA